MRVRDTFEVRTMSVELGDSLSLLELGEYAEDLQATGRYVTVQYRIILDTPTIFDVICDIILFGLIWYDYTHPHSHSQSLPHPHSHSILHISPTPTLSHPDSLSFTLSPLSLSHTLRGKRRLQLEHIKEELRYPWLDLRSSLSSKREWNVHSNHRLEWLVIDNWMIWLCVLSYMKMKYSQLSQVGVMVDDWWFIIMIICVIWYLE